MLTDRRFLETLRWDFNSLVHAGFIAATAALCHLVGWAGLLLYPTLHLASDVLYYVFHIAIFDPETTVQRGYQVSAVFNDTPHSQGLDYGFNLYDGDYGKSRQRAQADKFDYAFEQLGLERGMSVVDVGCGFGDWLVYLRDRGIEAVGVNISREQVQVCRERGLEVYHTNWKDIPADEELRKKLYGRFDRVTFWDTVEHYVPMQYRALPEKAAQIYRRMFQLARDLSKPEKTRVFVSCLHMRKRVRDLPLSWERLRVLWSGYLLDKFHSGCYPSAPGDELVTNAAPLFELIHRRDTTLDYFMTSKLERSHFGRHHFRWTPRRALYALNLVLADPYFAHRLLWFTREAWMDQFDHEEIDRSPVIHWWMTFESSGSA